MARPVPLMFIKSPSALNHKIDDYEESTSIFIKEKRSNKEDFINDFKLENDIVLKQLIKLQSPFGKHLYKPITIRLNDGRELFGSVIEIGVDELLFKNNDNHDGQMVVPLDDIIDILWQGKSIPVV